MTDEEIKEFIHANTAHECGHISVLFKTGRLVGLNYLPFEKAADGVDGVIEVEPSTPLGGGDCVAIAASMIGELVCLGRCDEERLAFDRAQIQEFAGQALEDFAPEAYESIKKDPLFFALLNIVIRPKMLQVITKAAHLPKPKMTIITLAEIVEVHKRAEAETLSLRKLPQIDEICGRVESLHYRFPKKSESSKV